MKFTVPSWGQTRFNTQPPSPSRPVAVTTQVILAFGLYLSCTLAMMVLQTGLLLQPSRSGPWPLLTSVLTALLLGLWLTRSAKTAFFLPFLGLNIMVSAMTQQFAPALLSTLSILIISQRLPLRLTIPFIAALAQSGLAIGLKYYGQNNISGLLVILPALHLGLRLISLQKGRAQTWLQETLDHPRLHDIAAGITLLLTTFSLMDYIHHLH